MYYGIDLGTTTTLVAEPVIKGSTFTGKNLKIRQLNKLKTPIEKEILPSYAYFPDGGEPIVGTFAREVANEPEKVVRAIKRQIGRDVEPIIFNGKEYYPSDISSLYIEHVIREAILKTPDARLNKLTVTVPASFTTKQRKDTVAAIQKAFNNTGVALDENVLISEPLAALLSYISYDIETGVNKVNIDSRPLILVYDIGGGTLDLTLVQLGWKSESEEKNLYNVNFNTKAVGRYNQVGGEDFDELIAEWLLHRFLEEFKELDIELTNNERCQIRHQLLMIAENLKIDFNKDYANDDEILPSRQTLWLRGKEYTLEVLLDYNEMNKILEPLIGKNDGPKNCIACIKKILSKHSTTSVNYILCVGGMSNFLMLRAAISKSLHNPTILFSKDLANVAVSQGAAIYTYMKARNSHVIREPRADAYYVKTINDFRKILGCHEDSRITQLHTTVDDSDDIDLFIFAGEESKSVVAEPAIYPSLMFQEAVKIPLGGRFPKGTPIQVSISNTGDNKMPSYEVTVAGKTVYFSEMEVN